MGMFSSWVNDATGTFGQGLSNVIGGTMTGILAPTTGLIQGTLAAAAPIVGAVANSPMGANFGATVASALGGSGVVPQTLLAVGGTGRPNTANQRTDAQGQFTTLKWYQKFFNLYNYTIVTDAMGNESFDYGATKSLNWVKISAMAVGIPTVVWGLYKLMGKRKRYGY